MSLSQCHISRPWTPSLCSNLEATKLESFEKKTRECLRKAMCFLRVGMAKEDGDCKKMRRGRECLSGGLKILDYVSILSS